MVHAADNFVSGLTAAANGTAMIFEGAAAVTAVAPDGQVMTAEVSEGAGVGEVTLSMRLHYGGTLWVPALDRVLADEIRRGRSRLAALVGTSADT